MGKVKVCSFSLSLDGYGAGPDQDLKHPLGHGGEKMHTWMLKTQTFHQKVLQQPGGSTGPDDDFARQGFENIGAWILGRNMFSPGRGAWDFEWKGWWGPNPPYHVPVFVLTHHARPPLEMEGGTVFHFVTEGAQVALERARKAAGEKDVRIGGGVSTIRQYLAAGSLDELHLAQSPFLMGSGEHFWHGLDLPKLGYQLEEPIPTPLATHLIIRRKLK